MTTSIPKQPSSLISPAIQSVPIQLLLIDDHPITLSGLKSEISRDTLIEVAGAYTTIEEALKHISQLKVDVILSDLYITHQSTALDLLHKMQERNLTIPLIILSGDDRVASIRKSFSLGVSAYLSKQSTGDAIRKAIHWVLKPQNREQVYLWPPSLRCAIFNESIPTIAQPNGLHKLTEKEKEVLRLYGQGAEAKEIAYSIDPKMALPTVYTHLQNIRRKLNLSNEVELRNFGLRYLSADSYLE